VIQKKTNEKGLTWLTSHLLQDHSKIGCPRF